MEAKHYYTGLPSAPVLVARTSTTPRKEPTGLKVYQTVKELPSVPLTEVWEGNLALKLHALLNLMKVKWTSTEVVRIGNVGEPAEDHNMRLTLPFYPLSPNVILTLHLLFSLYSSHFLHGPTRLPL